MKCHRSACSHFSEVKENILVVHLGALGAVLRSTSLLQALKKKHPHSRIVWVTQSPADQLLSFNPHIHSVVTLNELKLHPLTGLHFSAAYCIDKSLQASRVLKEFSIDKTFGFVTDPISGSVLPATSAADELWEIGLSNHKKFFVNKKTEQHLVHEALELGPYERNEYEVLLTEGELLKANLRKSMWRDEGTEFIVGLNVGCSAVIPYKKLSVEAQRQFIRELKSIYGSRVQCVLLGGREDQGLAEKIAKDLDVVVSPMNQGLRDGMLSLSVCDIIVTGDSLGMHLGIGFKKWVVAWFGPTCAHEIDLYERGQKVLSPVPCSPCWKRECNRTPMCYNQVSIRDLLDGVEKGVKWKFLSSKQPSLEISS